MKKVILIALLFIALKAHSQGGTYTLANKPINLGWADNSGFVTIRGKLYIRVASTGSGIDSVYVPTVSGEVKKMHIKDIATISNITGLQDSLSNKYSKTSDSIVINKYSGVPGVDPARFIGKYYNGSSGSALPAESGDVLAVFGARGYDGIDANGYSGWMQFNAAGDQSVTNNGTSFDMWLTPVDSGKVRKNIISANSDNITLGINTPSSNPMVVVGYRLNNLSVLNHKFQVVSEGLQSTMSMGQFGEDHGAGNAGGHWWAARGTQTSPLPLLSGDYLWSNGFRGWAPSGLQTSSASFYARAVEDFTNTTHGTELGFMTTKIGANANVGRTHTFKMQSDGVFSAPGLKQDSVLSAIAYMDTEGRLRAAVAGVDYVSPSGAVTSLTGTSNQVIVSASTGSVTLSLPQSIGTSSTPTFSTITGSVPNNTNAFVAGNANGKIIQIPWLTSISGSYIGAQNLAGTVNQDLYLDGASIKLLAPLVGSSGNFSGTVTVADATAAGHAVNKGQLDLKANIASPTFTGTPSAPTATAGTNTTQIATTAFVTAAVSASGSTSGTYTPTATGITGITSATPGVFHYQRIGNQVQVTGYVSVTNTTGGSSVLSVTLPVASTFSAVGDCHGPGSSNNVNTTNVRVYTLATDTVAYIGFEDSTASSSSTVYVSFMYTVI